MDIWLKLLGVLTVLVVLVFYAAFWHPKRKEPPPVREFGKPVDPSRPWFPR